MKTIITMRANVPDLKGFNLSKKAISDGMVRGWYKAGPHGSRTESRSFGRPTKSIPAQLGRTGNITISKGKTKGDVAAVGYVPGPHASIQDQGGLIRARVALGKLMRYVYWGVLRFSRGVGPSRIRPKQYIARGLREVAQSAGLVVQAVWVRKVWSK